MKPSEDYEICQETMLFQLGMLIIKGRITQNGQNNIGCVLNTNEDLSYEKEGFLSLWQSCETMYIEVWLYQDERFNEKEAVEGHSGYLLIEQWHIEIQHTSTSEAGFHCTEQMLMQAIKSKLYFSQLSAWLSLTMGEFPKNTYFRLCNNEGRTPLRSFCKNPEFHKFPQLNLSSTKSLLVSLHSLPRCDIVKDYPSFAWVLSASPSETPLKNPKRKPHTSFSDLSSSAESKNRFQTTKTNDSRSPRVARKLKFPIRNCTTSTTEGTKDTNLFEKEYSDREKDIKTFSSDTENPNSVSVEVRNETRGCKKSLNYLTSKEEERETTFFRSRSSCSLLNNQEFQTNLERSPGINSRQFSVYKDGKDCDLESGLWNPKKEHFCLNLGSGNEGNFERNTGSSGCKVCDNLERSSGEFEDNLTTFGRKECFRRSDCCKDEKTNRFCQEPFSCKDKFDDGKLNLDVKETNSACFKSNSSTSERRTLLTEKSHDFCDNSRGFQDETSLQLDAYSFKKTIACDNEEERCPKRESIRASDFDGKLCSVWPFVKEREYLPGVKKDFEGVVPEVRHVVEEEYMTKINEKFWKCLALEEGRCEGEKGKQGERKEIGGKRCTKEDNVFRERKSTMPRETQLASRYHFRHASTGTLPVFHPSTGLPMSSSPAPFRKTPGLTTVDDIRSPPCNSFSNLSNVLSKSAPTLTAQSLLGNFEESVLNDRLLPDGVVKGFSAELSASASRKCLAHVTLPVHAYFFKLSDDNAPSPYMGYISLDVPELPRKGYHVPKKGTIQLTLFNPNQTVVNVFVVLYDFSDMLPNFQTFLRQKTTSLVESDNLVDRNHDNLHYLIHLRFASSKSGRIYLHTDIRLIFARHPPDQCFLRTTTSGPTNPKYVPRPDSK